jgi:pyruvate,water dikinase
VAVRSSAVGEDGAQASFAGQHESYLNVQGAEKVAEAVEHCIDSVYAARAQAYRQWRGIHDEVTPVVLIQQFIQSDISCVVFSADPRNGSRDRVLVNAAWGLGESLVGGLVTPDLYVIAKRGMEVLESEIAEKRLMTVPCEDGTCEVPVPRALRCEPCLGQGQLLQLAQLAIQLEKRQGWAVDLECAFSAGKLFLLQCRPITTLG